LHVSSVTGCVLPEIAKITRERGGLLILDAARSAGDLDIDKLGVDVLEAAGHKGLYGPMGTGVSCPLCCRARGDARAGAGGRAAADRWGQRLCDPAPRTGVASFRLDAAEVALYGTILDELFGIAVRTGLHCSPAPRRAIGTFPGGTVRVRFGQFNTRGNVGYARRRRPSNREHPILRIPMIPAGHSD
jgi:cysteine desulfurase / selenocysteine lyase